ncbi:pyruvate dehydrogenase E1 component [Pseudomonas baetica]|uniref:Pyruvate dehydrogenase E1 component n=1 Tax=Pseudomonas baetica TaxID=674054 RepID=A0ABX4PXS6_9PSED|nr:pyruvate dehydrogenase [Pseudomonas baetica]PKA68194.1 pyruvate dehydrogenase E1 component [Pseudomonas baetica]PTC17935.1 pyruvate dehydrogenase [Pseudomonas baetica]
MIGFSSFSKTPETRLAAQACIDKIRTLTQQHTAGFSSPLDTMIDIANRLERDPETARHIWVIRSNKQSQVETCHTRISAWPLRFSPTACASEKPLLYLTSSATSAELCALSNESAQRGILCNDIETLPSRWPKGAHPWVPLWLVSNPHCLPFDPASGAEAHAITLAALQSLYVEGNDGFYYMTLHDEPNDFIAPISHLSASQALKGMYKLKNINTDAGQLRVRLLGAGLALQSVVSAAQILRDDWGVECELWSCPSYTRLARDADKAQRWNRMHPDMPRRSSHLLDCLSADDYPVVAVTGYAQHVVDQIGGHIQSRFVAFGADSTETPPGKTVDKRWIVALALRALAQEGVIAQAYVEQAMDRYLLR